MLSIICSSVFSCQLFCLQRHLVSTETRRDTVPYRCSCEHTYTRPVFPSQCCFPDSRCPDGSTAVAESETFTCLLGQIDQHQQLMESHQGCSKHHMRRDNWQKETPTERLDFSRNNEENTDQKRQEGSSQQQPHKGGKGNSSERHTAANREVKKSVKTDKRNFVEGLTQEAEKAAASRNMKQIYDTTRKLDGKFKKSERPMGDTNGSILMGADKQLDRWAEHFEELLNRPAPQNQPDIQPAETDLPIDCNKPIREEIKKAIAHEKWECSRP